MKFEKPEDYIREIKKLKEEKKVFLLAHNYQIGPIQDLADYVADSVGLARKAREAKDAKIIVVCGADFMAETAKTINPDKKVLIPDLDTVCPMAAMLKKEDIIAAKKKYPNAAVVLYVNSSAECKALADVCCTSANSIKIVNSLKENEIIFGPDRNLGIYTQRNTTKKIIPVPKNGFCYAHKKFKLEEIKKIMKNHPKALLLAHPECDPEIMNIADKIASTAGMLKYAKESDEKEFIIATEIGLLHTLQKQNPEKKFYPACEESVCFQQKNISLEDLYNCMKDEKFEVKIPREITDKAVKAINRMLEISD